MNQLVRFGVSLDQRLLKEFDRYIKRRRYTNRSEALRDLIRDNLVGQEWDENKETYRLSDKIVRTSNITQSTVIGQEGNFSTVIAAAVFLF